MGSDILANRYRIIRPLGQGGFGKTFLAEDIYMPEPRPCVVKQLIFATDDQQIYQRATELFQKEAAILQKLGELSNQIPKLYAYFVEEGSFYLVEELIVGKTLKEKLEVEGKLDEETVKDLLISLLPVLELVHSHKKIHRDIKLENIILRQHDNKPVLIDFGAVKESTNTELGRRGDSQPSIIIGTPAFMAPEQREGYPVYSSDLYSLALTAICLLTGEKNPKYMIDPSNGRIDWPQYSPDITPSLAEILDKAISIRCRDRYESAGKMKEALCALSRPIVSAVVLETLPSNSGEKPTVIGSPEQLKVDPESGATPPDSADKQDGSAPPTAPTVPPPTDPEPPQGRLSHCIIGNALILIALIFIGLVSNIVPLPLLPCAVIWAKVPSLAVTLLMTLHLLWRFLDLDASKFENPFIKILVSVMERLHPRKLPMIFLLSMTILLFFWIGLLQWHPPRAVLVSVSMPVIESLEVKFPNGTTGSYKPHGAIQMQTGLSITVTGVILSGSKVFCEWSANGGSLNPMEGCSARYTPPAGIKQDVLELRVTSFCGRWDVRAPFRINVQ